MNILDVNKKCVGCGACVDICPTKILVLKHNADGFYEPFAVNQKCVGCSKCINVCPVLNLTKVQRCADFYYGWSKQDAVKVVSSSGGIFSTFADAITGEGGVVFGAKYADDRKTVCMTSTDESNIDELRRSKYCQSKANGVYAKIACQLKQDKQVMLVGTPCQVAAARRYFGDKSKLLLVDFMCGGVTPDTAFSNYIEWIESKYNSKVQSINMRDKSAGWSKPRIRIEFENGKVYLCSYQMDYYYYYYCSADMKNEQCLSCSFTQHNDADITIADYWGFRNEKIFNDEKGMSIICVYTDKGRALFESVKNGLTLFDLRKEQVAYAYKEKYHSDAELSKRLSFLSEVRNSSFIEAAKNNYFKGGIAAVLARRILHKVGKMK